ncbi:MAG: DUF2752 domain-containing protein [Clostridia bacterium]
MSIIKKQKLWVSILIIIAPFILFVVAYLLKEQIAIVAEYIPKCGFKRVTGYACPGCGNTRSVFALLNFDILGSLRLNITPIVGGIILFILYLEVVFASFGKKVIIFPRKSYVIYIILAVMITYFLVRNFIPFLAV